MTQRRISFGQGKSHLISLQIQWQVGKEDPADPVFQEVCSEASSEEFVNINSCKSSSAEQAAPRGQIKLTVNNYRIIRDKISHLFFHSVEQKYLAVPIYL